MQDHKYVLANLPGSGLEKDDVKNCVCKTVTGDFRLVPPNLDIKGTIRRFLSANKVIESSRNSIVTGTQLRKA